jgi:hypothetical protein
MIVRRVRPVRKSAPLLPGSWPTVFHGNYLCTTSIILEKHNAVIQKDQVEGMLSILSPCRPPLIPPAVGGKRNPSYLGFVDNDETQFYHSKAEAKSTFSPLKILWQNYSKLIINSGRCRKSDQN